jgi:hypothetical protein
MTIQQMIDAVKKQADGYADTDKRKYITGVRDGIDLG